MLKRSCFIGLQMSWQKVFSTAIKIIPNQQLVEELHKPLIRKFIRKFQKRKVYSSFKDNIWGADLVDMQLKSKLSLLFPYLLLIFIVKIRGWFLWKAKRVLQLLILFKKF